MTMTGTRTTSRNRLGERVIATVATVMAPTARVKGSGRRRRAAVALALGLLVMLAVQLATGWAIQTDRMPLRDPLYLDKLASLRAHPGFAPTGHPTGAGDPLRVVFLGSSRTLDAVDAGAAQAALTRRLGRPVAAFNFAHPGAGPVANALYLRRLLNDGVRPDAFVIEVHPALLASQSGPAEVHWFPVIRLRPEEMPIVRRLGFPVAQPAAHGWRGWLLPWYEYRFPLVDRYATQFSVLRFPMGRQQADGHGFVRCREPDPAERGKLLELTRDQYAGCFNGYQPGGCGVAAVRDALETSRAAGVRAALVLTPESSEFRAWYPEPGRSQIGPILTGLAREFDCPLFDGRQWLADELIGDGHHLTGRGADAFTQRLTCEALAPWLSGGAP
jgi:hypothetical protein